MPWTGLGPLRRVDQITQGAVVDAASEITSLSEMVDRFDQVQIRGRPRLRFPAKIGHRKLRRSGVAQVDAARTEEAHALWTGKLPRFTHLSTSDGKRDWFATPDQMGPCREFFRVRPVHLRKIEQLEPRHTRRRLRLTKQPARSPA